MSIIAHAVVSSSPQIAKRKRIIWTISVAVKIFSISIMSVAIVFRISIKSVIVIVVEPVVSLFKAFGNVA